MSFLAPWMALAGLGAAIGVVALHLLSTRRPPERVLPTARFVPAGEARAVSRSARPTDLLLLALRALAVLCVGLGFAQPVLDAPGGAVRRVVALEWTTALRAPDSARALATALLRTGDALVVYDTAARVVAPEALATLPAATVRRASLSPMLVAARDAATQIARGADSLELVLLGALGAEQWDAATDSLRATWPGRVAHRPVEAALDTAAAPVPTLLGASADDALRPTIANLPVARGTHPVRVQRGTLTGADSAWLRETAGGVLLWWPEAVGAPAAEPSRPATDASTADASATDIPSAGASRTPDGVWFSGVGPGAGPVVVAALARRPVADGQVLARWRDGSPAVTERAVGAGCLREVGLVLPIDGDITLRPALAEAMAALVVPCGGARLAARADDASVEFLGDGPLAAASVLERSDEAQSPWTPWLLTAALVLLVVESFVRRRQPMEAA